MLLLFIFLFYLTTVFSKPSCTIGENYCIKCDNLTNYCNKCENSNILVPDEKGGCTGNKKCSVDVNYCKSCNKEETLCDICKEGYFPDKIGGCSNTKNCLFSYSGECLYCEKNFVLVSDSNKKKICKSKDDNFANCEIIDEENGICQKCIEGYYLNEEDKKCSDTKYCNVSVIGKCIKCQKGYYLDHSDERKCKLSFDNENFLNCAETEDGETCSKCDDESYFDYENRCIKTKFCSQSDGYICKKCIDNYFLTIDGKSCVNTENCTLGDVNTGICYSCNIKNYLDDNDGQCKSNQGDDDLKYCAYFTNKCLLCDDNYFFADDEKCTYTRNCVKVDNGDCKKCHEGYFLTSNGICTNIEHCLMTKMFFTCDECEDGYYFSKYETKCLKAEGNLEHCKQSAYGKLPYCNECKNGFYISHKDYTCKSNKEKGPFYKCSKSDLNEEACVMCEKGYYFGIEDQLCSSIENCAVSKDTDKCIKCAQNFCLNSKFGTCHRNDYVEEEDKKFYYRCLKTNEDANKCETCMKGYKLNKKGLCYNIDLCEKESEDGECIKCKDTLFDMNGYCLNKDFGCVNNEYIFGCLRCDGNLNFNNCTKCEEGFELMEGIYKPGYYSCKN